MSFMRLGTRTAVFDEQGRILLAKRGDFGTWALPGGRVDSGELLHESAAREVQEETGLEVEIECAVGLYFQQGRSRTNILHRAKVTGGELLSSTDETLDSGFFPMDDLPQPLFGQFYIDDAVSPGTHVRTLETPRWELFKLDMKLRWRWIQNWLAGRPEPSFVPFDVRVVGIVWDHAHERVFMKDDSLPEAQLDGSIGFETALNRVLHQKLEWQWIGLYQQPAQNRLDFILEAQHDFGASHGTLPDDLAQENHRIYTQQPQNETVWLITE